MVKDLFKTHMERLYTYVWSLHKTRRKRSKSLIQVYATKVVSSTPTEPVAEPDFEKGPIEKALWRFGEQGEVILEDFTSLSVIANEAFMRGLLYAADEMQATQDGHQPLSLNELVKLLRQSARHKIVLKMFANEISHAGRLRVNTANHLNRIHPRLHCMPESLHLLKKKYRDEGRKFLRTSGLLDPIKANEQLKEVFKKSKVPKSSPRPSFKILSPTNPFSPSS